MHWQWNSETLFVQTMKETVEPFWQQEVRLGVMQAQDGVKLHYAYAIPANHRGTLVISNGRIESLLKYQEVVYELYQNGFASFTLDHRGQGLSARQSVDPQQGYVRDFADYVDDILQFLDEVVAPTLPDKPDLLCHSMGSAIGALAVLKAPSRFCRLVFCSPMFGIRPALPEWFARSLIRTGLSFNRWRRRSSGYFFGQGAYQAYPFALNPLTHSEVRYQWFRDLYQQRPDIQLGGVTSEWLYAAFNAMQTIYAQAHHIQHPSLILSAGADKVVDNRRQRLVADRMPQARFVTVAGARHELLHEADSYRQQALQHLYDFLSM